MIKNSILVLFSVCALLTAASTTSFAQAGASRTRRVAPLSERGTEMQIFELVNGQRQSSNRPALGWNDEIAAVARAYSERMAREDFFDHYDPEGRTAIDRAEKIRGWKFIGENLFVSENVLDLPGFAVHGWLGSETHRTNMLDPQWTTTGIGVARAANGDIYVTELFTRK
jgi:uncharacterized protein YkwD